MRRRQLHQPVVTGRARARLILLHPSHMQLSWPTPCCRLQDLGGGAGAAGGLSPDERV